MISFRVKAGSACLVKLGLAACLSAGAVHAFSEDLSVYQTDPTAETRTVDDIYNRTLGSATLSAGEEQLRKSVIAMYRSLGFDVSLDNEQIIASQVLIGKIPDSWSTDTPKPLSGSYEQPYSIDAPWNNPIPADHPRVPLSAGYYSTVQITAPDSAAYPGGDGIGIGVVISGSGAPLQSIAHAWINQAISRSATLRIREDAVDFRPRNFNGDEHVIFIDDESKTAVTTYQLRLRGETRFGTVVGDTAIGSEIWNQEGTRPGYDHRALTIGVPHRLDGLGKEGVTGSYAAGVTELGFLLRPGEVNDPVNPIPHALAGASNLLMKARIYPAVSMDGFINTAASNRGAVPYGAAIQLDPGIDLDALYQAGKLSLPGYRLLEAIQTYGWYMMDSTDGGSGNGKEFMIYSGAPAADFNVQPPSAGGANGLYAVAQELEKFLAGDPFFGIGQPVMYVAAPNVKYAPDTEPPSVPTGLISPAQTSTSVALEWEASTDNRWVSGYEIYADGIMIAHTTSTDFTVKELDPQTAYIFTVKARDNSGNLSQASDPLAVSTAPLDTVPPGTPPNLSVSFPDAYSAQLSWDAASDNVGVTGYIVMVNEEEAAIVTGTGHTVLHLLPDTCYTFSVAAMDAENNVSVPAASAGRTPASNAYNIDFDDGLAPHWTLSAQAEVRNGRLQLANWSGGAQAVYDGESFSGHYTYQIGVRTTSGSNNNKSMILFNYTDDDNYYFLEIGGGASGNSVNLSKRVQGANSILAAYTDYPIQTETTFVIEYEAPGLITVSGWKSGVETVLFQQVADASHTSGKIGVRGLYTTTYYDNVSVVRID